MKMTAKRRRSKQTIKEEKALEAQRQHEIASKMAKIDDMERFMQEQQNKI